VVAEDLNVSLPLHVRVYDCEHCDLVMDRDANAAADLAARAAAASQVSRKGDSLDTSVNGRSGT
jgi:transposase